MSGKTKEINLMYCEIVTTLFKRFPHYLASPEIEHCDFDLPRVVYANFGRYFNRIVSEADNPISNPEIIEICKFLDEMAICKDKNVADLLGTAFFEAVISDKKPVVEESLKTLNTLLQEDSKIILRRQQGSKTLKSKAWRKLDVLFKGFK